MNATPDTNLLDGMDPQASVFDWLNNFTAEIVAGMARRPGPANAVHDKLSFLVGQSCEGGNANLDSLFCYIAAAHGLHAAGEEARAVGDETWAAELHSLGQLFLHYATSDINAIVTAQAQSILATVADSGASVH